MTPRPFGDDEAAAAVAVAWPAVATSPLWTVDATAARRDQAPEHHRRRSAARGCPTRELPEPGAPCRCSCPTSCQPPPCARWPRIPVCRAPPGCRNRRRSRQWRIRHVKAPASVQILIRLDTSIMAAALAATRRWLSFRVLGSALRQRRRGLGPSRPVLALVLGRGRARRNSAPRWRPAPAMAERKACTRGRRAAATSAARARRRRHLAASARGHAWPGTASSRRASAAVAKRCRRSGRRALQLRDGGRRRRRGGGDDGRSMDGRPRPASPAGRAARSRPRARRAPATRGRRGRPARLTNDPTSPTACARASARAPARAASLLAPSARRPACAGTGWLDGQRRRGRRRRAQRRARGRRASGAAHRRRCRHARAPRSDRPSAIPATWLERGARSLQPTPAIAPALPGGAGAPAARPPAGRVRTRRRAATAPAGTGIGSVRKQSLTCTGKGGILTGGARTS